MNIAIAQFFSGTNLIADLIKKIFPDSVIYYFDDAMDAAWSVADLREFYDKVIVI